MGIPRGTESLIVNETNKENNYFLDTDPGAYDTRISDFIAHWYFDSIAGVDLWAATPKKRFSGFTFRVEYPNIEPHPTNPGTYWADLKVYVTTPANAAGGSYGVFVDSAGLGVDVAPAGIFFEIDCSELELKVDGETGSGE
jgi:rubredoxin